MGHADARTAGLYTSRNEPSSTHVHAIPTRRHEQSLNCFSIWNCRGLKPRTVPSKVPYIQDLVRDQNQLFMALTETWLCEHVDAELTVEGYTLFRQDRKRQKKRKGRDSGGVAVYVRDDLAADMVTVASYSNGVIEFLGLYSKTKNLLLLVMYRQPDDIIGHIVLWPKTEQNIGLKIIS